MCSFGIDVKELVEKFNESLNDMEGDFDSETLHKALEITKNYPWVSNSKSQEDAERWGDYLNGDEDAFSEEKVSFIKESDLTDVAKKIKNSESGEVKDE